MKKGAKPGNRTAERQVCIMIVSREKGKRPDVDRPDNGKETKDGPEQGKLNFKKQENPVFTELNVKVKPRFSIYKYRAEDLQA